MVEPGSLGRIPPLRYAGRPRVVGRMSGAPAPPAAPLGGRGWGAVAVMVILFGTSLPVLDLAYPYLPPLWIGFFRFAICLPLLFVVAHVVIRKRPVLSWSLRLRGFAVGALALGLYTSAVLIGLRDIAPGLATVLVSTVPLFVIVFAMTAGYRMPRAKLLGIGGGFVGVLVVAGGGGQVSGGQAIDMVLIVGGAALFAAGTYIQRQWFQPADYLWVDVWEFLGAAVMMVVLAMAFQPVSAATLVQPGPWPALSWSLASTGVGYLIWFILLSRGRASTVSGTLFIVPIVSLGLSYYWFRDPVTLVQGIGVLIILLAVL